MMWASLVCSVLKRKSSVQPDGVKFVWYSHECRFLCVMVWWADLGWPPDPHPDAVLLFLLVNEGEENKKKRLMSWDKDKEVAYGLLSCIKHTQLGEKYFNLLPVKIGLDSKKQRQNLKTTFPPPFHPFFPGSYLKPFPKSSAWLWSAHNSSFLLLLPSHPALLQCGFPSMGWSPSENLLNCDLFHGHQMVSTVAPEAHPPLLLLWPWCSQDCFSQFLI